MPFKSVSTVFNPGEVAHLRFKIEIVNRKKYDSLDISMKHEALSYLDDCIGYIEYYKKFIKDDIMTHAQKHESHPLLVSMLATSETGWKCIEAGFTNDALGEVFDEDEMYHTEEMNGHLCIFKTK